jgi:acetoin:2,6-dichlorophenolindophenol oxidoreductase subunit alpha
MPAGLDETLKWQCLERMLLIRRFEETVVKLAGDGHFRGHYHLYIGQEGTGVPAIMALAPKDHLATTHRNHGHILARGADPGAGLAEILGRATGLNGGRGGTIHLCDPALGFLSTSGVVGGCISLAVGGGYACRQRGDGSVTMALFGDGALEEGVSFEALNIASLWHLPVIFMCENNSAGAMGVAKGGYPTLVHASTDLRLIPQAVGISSVRVDGVDVAAVHAAVTEAVARCRAGKGPVFIEAMTPRWAGSNPLWPELATGITDLGMATGKPGAGGPHKEWYEHYDPILRLAREMAKGGAESIRRMSALDEATRKRIAAAADFALKSPLPAPETALDHVFAKETPA